MSAALFSYAKSRPPKTPRRRLLWACVVLLFSGAALPFAIWGVVEQILAGEVMGALVMVLLSVLLLFSIGAAIYAFVDLARARRAARRTHGAGAPAAGAQAERGTP